MASYMSMGIIPLGRNFRKNSCNCFDMFPLGISSRNKFTPLFVTTSHSNKPQHRR